MNIKYLEMVVRDRVCPACSVGMTREVGPRIYQCDHTRCGERFDLSHLTDQMISDLLKKKAAGKLQSKAAKGTQ